jgi:hypothetical protein
MSPLAHSTSIPFRLHALRHPLPPRVQLPITCPSAYVAVTTPPVAAACSSALAACTHTASTAAVPQLTHTTIRATVSHCRCVCVHLRPLHSRGCIIRCQELRWLTRCVGPSPPTRGVTRGLIPGIPGLLGRPGSRWGLHNTRKGKDEAPCWSFCDQLSGFERRCRARRMWTSR